jgi:hypothetical protein
MVQQWRMRVLVAVTVMYCYYSTSVQYTAVHLLYALVVLTCTDIAL